MVMLTIEKEEGFPVVLLPTYLAMAERSTGSNQYRRFLIRRPEGDEDVIGDGDLGCVSFVSSILIRNLCLPDGTGRPIEAVYRHPTLAG
jgi:hypothetical protein